ncbi:unnamed protein product [Closterium sp. Yama58-4]|nr:unnamed protein product [Closterium sp. Yama58-4]
MLDPGIKEQQGYGPVESGDAADVWILNAEGKAFVGDAINEQQGYGPVESGDAADREGALWGMKLLSAIKEQQGYGPVESGDAADVWILNAEGKAFVGDAINEQQGYGPVESGDAADVWILNAQGKAFVVDVWPGPCKFPDYTMQRAREWWRDMVADFAKEGVDGIWNDMNEPTVFRAVNKTMPDDNIHRGDDHMGGTQNHLHYHNVYGMLMARATSEGLGKALPDKRPFVLTRAGFIGSQRYAASWTGDNLATWEYLHMSVPMALNMVRYGVVRYGVVHCRMVGDVATGFIGSQRYAASWTGDILATWEYLHMSMALNMALSGQPLNGPDIGGFALNATPRLFARWMGIGALLPFSRGHSEKGTKDAEPWVFGEAVRGTGGRVGKRIAAQGFVGMGIGVLLPFSRGHSEKGTKDAEPWVFGEAAIERRYRLLPHLYTLFFHHDNTGSPVISPLVFAGTSV